MIIESYFPISYFNAIATLSRPVVLLRKLYVHEYTLYFNANSRNINCSTIIERVIYKLNRLRLRSNDEFNHTPTTLD